uniref:iron ABC transporter substrate-binding protein n=1 Tax=Candidatus Planktophila sp. TaxID=2175601 RepID=UPI00404B4DAB
MKKSWITAGVALAALILGGLTLVQSGSDSSGEQVKELTIYSGRSEEFIAPFFANWEQESGIKLNVRYGDSAELAAQILEEGNNSPADLFLSQDAGSLGAVSAAGLFSKLPTGVGSDIEDIYIAGDRSWIGVTGRARVFAYNPKAVTLLPQSVADLTKPAYKGRVGIAPSNASFQAFVTALTNEKGATFAENWLKAMKDNGAQIYLKNSAIVEAIDKGAIDLGLVNHYYTWEVSQALGRDIDVENGFFAPGDIGNLVNVSGIGILGTSEKQEVAQGLINYLTSEVAQAKFVEDTHEYSLIPGAKAPESLPELKSIGSPKVDLASLEKVQATQDLLTKVGLL